jgi:PhzF family phenazine biosynthesis protein
MTTMYQVDAFATKLFEGNPAAVIILDDFLEDIMMQDIASENNLSETAFVCLESNSSSYNIRWFTPNGEVDLCGHATLASAFVLHKLKKFKYEIIFNSKSGLLNVKHQDDRFILDFPSDKGLETEVQLPDQIMDNSHIYDIIEGKDDILIITNEETVKGFNPKANLISMLPKRGLIISSKSKEFDFISRCFYPKYGILEDPVTGSAHTLLTPYWAMRLGKNKLIAKQVSNRGGILECVYRGHRVSISGTAKLYMKAELFL